MRGYDLSELRVLLADDSAMMRELLSTSLRTLGIREIVTAEDGVVARKRLKTFLPDVILLDILMPRMDGIEFTRHVRAGDYEINPFVPIIIVSGFTDMAHIGEARDAGANEFLAKPISVKSLYTRLAALVGAPRPFVRAGEFVGPDRRRRAERRMGQDVILPSERRHDSRRTDDRDAPQGQPASPFEGLGIAV